MERVIMKVKFNTIKAMEIINKRFGSTIFDLTDSEDKAELDRKDVYAEIDRVWGKMEIFCQGKIVATRNIY